MNSSNQPKINNYFQIYIKTSRYEDEVEAEEIIEIEEIFDQDVLGFKKFPFENQEVVSSRMSLSPRRKSIKFRC